MGASAFIHTRVDYSAGEAFNKLVAEAEYEDGHDSYNGTISTCGMGRVTKFSDVCTPAVEKKAYKYIKDHDNGSKWVASVLDLGVVGYEQILVKKVSPTHKNPAKYQQRFVVYRMEDEYNREKYVKDFGTKSEADTFAMKKTMENPDTEYVVRKKPIIVNSGSDTVTLFKIEKKTLKTRPKSVKTGAILKEKHKYVFYGWASS
jgi:hypothetical protein